MLVYIVHYLGSQAVIGDHLTVPSNPLGHYRAVQGVGHYPLVKEEEGV